MPSNIHPVITPRQQRVVHPDAVDRADNESNTTIPIQRTTRPATERGYARPERQRHS